MNQGNNSEKDYSDISDYVSGAPEEAAKPKRDLLQGIEGEQRWKLIRWGIEPLDYDAPGTTVREMGV